MLELARALRRDGFVVTHLSVGDASITLEPVIAPLPAKRGRADAGGVVAEYGGAAIEKLLGEDADGGDEDYVPAVKA